MTTRLSFALTALISLFFLEGLSSLFGVLFALVYDGIFPEVHLSSLLLAAAPVAALVAPALPFSRWVERSSLIAGSAAIAAAARILLSLPAFPVRLAASALVVASGAIFLGKAVGYVDRRVTAAAVATAFALDGLLRFAGWSWDITMRPAWVPAQVLVSALTLAVAVAWWRRQRSEGQGVDPVAPLERRAGGVRLRGAIALACILFLQMNVLARAEVAHRWLGVPYPLAAATLIVAATIAALFLYGKSGPIGAHRSIAMLLTALCAAGVFIARWVDGSHALPLLVFAVGHAAGLLLLDRALLPATGRRRGWRLAAGLATLLLLNAGWVVTFYYAFTLPAFEGRAGALLGFALVLLAATLALTPRPLPTAAGPLRPITAALAFVALAGIARLLAAREAAPPVALAQDTITVATYNIHYGYGVDWRFDPESIARTIEASGASVVALQEVPAGLIIAYSTDLALWLGHRLGMRVLSAPSINGLLGDAILTRLPVVAFETRPLPPRGSDRKLLTSARLDAGADTLILHAVHFGITESEQEVQLEASLPTLLAGTRAVFVGDLNAEPGSGAWHRLRAVGFQDAFDLAGQPAPPTWPSQRPVVRIDWIWVRGYDAGDAIVSSGAGSDHRLVSARLRRR